MFRRFGNVQMLEQLGIWLDLLQIPVPMTVPIPTAVLIPMTMQETLLELLAQIRTLKLYPIKATDHVPVHVTAWHRH